jgi:hypothetical protein
MKQVSQLDQDGYFVGVVSADPSPLEPGVYLIPGGAVDAPAPTIPEGQRAKWDGAWVFEDIPQPEPEPEPKPIDPTQLRITELKQLLADSDYKVLPDYDKTNDTIKAQRQAWRDEIRTLEDKTNE